MAKSQLDDVLRPLVQKRLRELVEEEARKLLGGGMGAGGTKTASRRARKRKGMSAAQKRAVSARMKKYWAERRKAKKS